MTLTELNDEIRERSEELKKLNSSARIKLAMGKYDEAMMLMVSNAMSQSIVNAYMIRALSIQLEKPSCLDT